MGANPSASCLGDGVIRAQVSADDGAVHCLEPVAPLLFRHLQRMHAARQPLHLHNKTKKQNKKNKKQKTKKKQNKKKIVSIKNRPLESPSSCGVARRERGVSLFSYGIDVFHSHESLAEEVRAVGGQHHVALDHR